MLAGVEEQERRMSQGETPTMDARAEAIEVMADAAISHRVSRAWADPERGGWSAQCHYCGVLVYADSPLGLEHARHLHAQEAALDALLQPTEQTCERCQGTGGVCTQSDYEQQTDAWEPCSACSGGLVQRPPLVILASTEHDADDRATAVSLLNWVNTSAAADSMDYRLMRQAVKDFLAHRRLRVEGEQPDA